MSVICQNFVQNAWKKDLCSNCFKSVGDHEMSDSGPNDQMKNSNQNDKSNGRYVSQASSGSPSMSNSAPHTTWKSLISERNSKNSQPFKLETGFQGRLLTINKASHAGEKNGVNNGSLKNGHASDSELSSHQQSKRTTNGRVTKTDFSQIKKNSQSINGYSVQNGNRHLEVKVEHNGTKIKDINGTTFQKIHDANRETSKQGFSTASKELKLIKSKSEDTLYIPLHSILKKTVSTPVSEKQSRRGSNVGFAEEEPLVIGYGGRDFSAEELEWDMNSSDGENDNGMDSLDETEDDKAFSTMTRRNTEFNSDNANLIQKNASNAEKKEARRSEKNTEQKEIDKTSSHAAVTSEECNGNMKNGINSLIKSTKSAVQVITDDDSDTERQTMVVKNKDGSTNEDKSALHNGSKLAEMEIKDSKLERQLPRKDTNDSINVSIKGDKTKPVVASGEVTIVETAAKVGDSRAEVKNNSVNEAVPPSRAISTTTNFDGTHCERSENQVMFSDGEERLKETSNPVADENSEWQDGDGLAGQILQAINTSLANRHKMNDNQEIESADDKSSESTNEDKNKERSSTERCNGANSASEASTDKNTSSDEEIVQNGINVEPRKSFLHGLTSNKTNKPSAIYGPASDLFVSRSNSSSSSSSDELSKNEITHSINVIVNGNKAHKLERNDAEDITESETEDLRSQHSYLSEQDSNCSIKIKAKPKIPMKPLKKPVQPPMKQTVNEYSETKPVAVNRRNSDPNILNDSYYSEANSTSYSESPNNISLVGHYAESNIYHEVDNAELKIQDEQAERIDPRESKLAALAMELEQVRHNNTKRQAPAPPKIPDPPLEDPPNSIGRVSPSISDNSHGFPSYRGEVMGFSSASSTASTSSQDTETGYASWNLHGDLDDQRKHSKSKSSFLLTQYSKCKMLAMGYADDTSRSRKKFSIKKLLKIKKENEGSATFDPNGPNPKAWKYSDNFDKPRPKLEIIHPMDLENKLVTVNPGFDSLHSGSMSSFSASADDLSLRNSVSSDYGSFYSDAISPIQDLKTEVNYECIPTQLPASEEQEDGDEKHATRNSNSPTPSRSSCISQASTLTSGSSKNGGASPHRPPKPPPPPRAHSLLPGNKALNPDGTFKFPIVNCNSVNGMEVPVSPTKPQAPKRQSKSSIQRFECGIYDNTGLVPMPEEVETPNENNSSLNSKVSVDGNTYGTILDIRSTNLECHNSGIQSPTTISDPPTDEKKEDTESQSDVLVSKSEIQSINVTVTTVTDPVKKFANTVISRNKHSPLTKAPARPPPIYMKSQINNIVKNPNPWKTLEDSYLVLTASNRELLVKLVNQALKKRKNFLVKLQRIKFQWAEFEIDVEQPSSVFAFGEKIAYHATMPKHPEYSVTLVVTVQQQHCRLNENNDIKYPVFGQFVDYIPKELLENSSDAELESMQATILVLDRSNISTIECFTESLPISLTEENEKELCFIILQLIHSLKTLQAQGIESIESSFQNLILAKTKKDKYNTLVFLYDNCYDENDYMSDSCKISLCQYTLMLLFQMLGIQSIEEFILISDSKFSSEVAKKVFKTAISLLSEEKAVSLSQTKTLFECFFWEITRVFECLEDSEDVDNVLHRWLDIKRVNYIKNIYDEENVCDINIQSEYYSQFLLRTSIRNVREILSLL